MIDLIAFVAATMLPMGGVYSPWPGSSGSSSPMVFNLKQIISLDGTTFEADLPQPEYATITLSYNGQNSSDETSVARNHYHIVYLGNPAEAVLNKKGAMTLLAGATGVDGTKASTASVKMTLPFNPKLSKLTFSIASPADFKGASLNKLIRIFEFKLAGAEADNPRPIEVACYIAFSKVHH
jgi:hypothetical protein